MIESWTSATVLRAGLSLDRLLRAMESDRAVSRYAMTSPTDSTWPRWLRWSTFCIEGEVDDDTPILRYLDQHLVRPILDGPTQTPSGADGTVSVLLFGPPGTSKTTVARAIADGLHWPVVELNPGVFIERGLELIEARAHEVFEDLHRMERVVVLFDECDELFRQRGPRASSEQIRSITAFVTASMLPKLQRLHDEGRVVFFVCTNNFSYLDPAIKRRGRIDHIVAVGPPGEQARKRIVAAEFRDNEYVGAASRLWTGTERFTRSELTQLIRMVQRQLPAMTHPTGETIDELIGRLIETFRTSLNISHDMFEEFKEQQRTASHPHLYKGAY